MSIIISAQTAASSTVNVVTTTATSLNHLVSAIGNGAEAANVKSSAWLAELKEDTADLAILRKSLREDRIALRIASEQKALLTTLKDEETAKLFRDAKALLAAARATA